MSDILYTSSPRARQAVLSCSLALLTACATAPETAGPPLQETAFALTADGELLRFNAGQPQRVLDRKPVQGLVAGDSLVGIDFRVARGVLYGLGRQGVLYTLDTTTARATRVGSAALAVALPPGRYGFDFNPAADRIRVVNGRFNLRLHPDTGAAVDGDATAPGVQPDADLAYGAGDSAAGQTPDIVAAAYTYNKQDDKLTTNYALDRQRGTLVMQGSREGVQPVVSPNTGRLSTVGNLGLGRFDDASFDIADVSGAAFAAIRSTAGAPTRWYRIDLTSGRAQLIGTLAGGAAVVGVAIEP